MKVSFEKSIANQVLKRAQSLKGNVILRSDIADLAEPRQISRALKKLVEMGYLTKLGYGIYAKLTRSTFANTTYLSGGALPTMREALTRLNIKWEPSKEEKAYQAGRSTQVPANPTTQIKTRFYRKLQYKGMELAIARKP